MIDCQICYQTQIGSLQEPICVIPEDHHEFAGDTCCKQCFVNFVGRGPTPDEQNYDPEDLTPEERATLGLKKYRVTRTYSMDPTCVVGDIWAKSVEDASKTAEPVLYAQATSIEAGCYIEYKEEVEEL